MDKNELFEHGKKQKEKHDHWIRSQSEKIIMYFSDSEPIHRKDKIECKFCYYIDSKVGGDGFVISYCENCSTRITNTSTCVDNLCRACANKLILCKHCGADMD